LREEKGWGGNSVMIVTGEIQVESGELRKGENASGK
jgi:hypothetical protein